MVCISQDSFYRDLNNEDLALAHKSEYNFDHPRTIDDEAILELLTELSSGRPGKVPEYDFKVSHNISQVSNLAKMPNFRTTGGFRTSLNRSSQPRSFCSRAFYFFTSKKFEIIAT